MNARVLIYRLKKEVINMGENYNKHLSKSDREITR